MKRSSGKGIDIVRTGGKGGLLEGEKKEERNCDRMYGRQRGEKGGEGER